MVSAKSSNERPYITIPTNAQPPRDPMCWPTCADGADDQPPVVPPKDPHYSPVYLSPVSTSFPPNAHARPRYTSFTSVYEPQATSMAFPEPQPYHQLPSRPSILGLAPPIRHRGSRSDVGLAASTDSLWRPNSYRGSYPATVFSPFCFTWAPLTHFRLAGTPSSCRRST